VKRREFITLVGGAATWPLAAQAQRSLSVIGYLTAVRLNDSSVVPFREGLVNAGYVEGRNLTIEYSPGGLQTDPISSRAAGLVSRPVSAIFAIGTVAAQAAKAATTTIPIVFVTGDDPVARGLVTSLNQPGGNVTGISFVSAALASKRLQLLRSLIPKADVIGVLSDTSPESQSQSVDAQIAARSLAQQLVVHSAGTDDEIDAGFADLIQRKAGALLIAGGPFLFSRGARLAALAQRHAIPVMYTFRDFAPGGLISYGASFGDTMRQGGVYIGRVLRGENPAALTVLQPNKFELVLNAKTAKALGVELSPMLLALADEVIE
jgi:putative ABC transport system substrate-binding protein